MNVDKEFRDENRSQHAEIRDQLVAIQEILRTQPQECGKTFANQRTFWKLIGIMILISVASFGYTSGVLAYVLKHIGI